MGQQCRALIGQRREQLGAHPGGGVVKSQPAAVQKHALKAVATQQLA
ncbi:MAG: hypothetical protein RJA98_2275, partial [Pseudomonadota bacterium]